MPSVKKSKAPVRLRITVKNSVDKPTIKASVPAMDKRSFQISILTTPIDFSRSILAYIPYYAYKEVAATLRGIHIVLNRLLF